MGTFNFLMNRIGKKKMFAPTEPYGLWVSMFCTWRSVLFLDHLLLFLKYSFLNVHEHK